MDLSPNMFPSCVVCCGLICLQKWKSQVRNSLPAKVNGLSFGLSSSHGICLVCVTFPMWFTSYCIGAGVYLKDSDCGFPLPLKKKKNALTWSLATIFFLLSNLFYFWISTNYIYFETPVAVELLTNLGVKG